MNSHKKIHVLIYSRGREVDFKTKASEPADAAALIAEALKRKFAHRYQNNSEHEDKEDFKLCFTEESSKPAAPLVIYLACMYFNNILLCLLIWFIFYSLGNTC